MYIIKLKTKYLIYYIILHSSTSFTLYDFYLGLLLYYTLLRPSYSYKIIRKLYISKYLIQKDQR